MQDLEDHHWFLYTDRSIEVPDFLKLNATQTTLRKGNLKGSLVSTAFAQWQFPRWAKQDNCDLFWSPRHQLPLLLRAGTPTVLSIHDLVFRSHPETMRRSGRLLEALLTPASMRRSSILLASSASVKKAIGHYYPGNLSKTAVTLLSSSLHEQPQERTECAATQRFDQPYFVFSGTLEPRKNVDRLLAAFERVKSAGNIPHQLVLISSGGWMHEQTLQTVHRLGSYVHLVQDVSEAQKAQIFRGAEFIALPSLHEGYGIPLAEGIKLGKPVLTSNLASMPEVAGAAGEYVNPLDEASISAALERLCTDRKHLQALSAAAKKMSQQYGWRDCAEQILAAFHQAVEGAPISCDHL